MISAILAAPYRWAWLALQRLVLAAGSLIEIDFRIKESATAGQTSIDLRQVSVNEGSFVLTPAPELGPDPTDGLITIKAPENAAPVTVTKADEVTGPVTAAVPDKPVPRVNLDVAAQPEAVEEGGRKRSF